jgi:hypothetical protein
MKQTISRRRLVMLVSVLVSALAVGVSGFRAAQPLPESIGDGEFWRMVSDFSERGGYFRFENFLSNEIEYQSVIPALKAGARSDSVYMGVGPEQNFTYLAALAPRMAFIIDIRRQNMIELLMYKALFEMSADRADFVSRLFSRRRPVGLNEKSTAEELFRAYQSAPGDKELYASTLSAMKETLVRKHRFTLTSDDLSNIDYVFAVFFQSGPDMDYSSGGTFGGRSMPTYADLMTADDRGGPPVNRSYLATEENYRRVRTMQLKNLIVPLVGDFAGAKTIRAVGEYLKRHDATVSAFYLSNVEQYLFGDGVERKFYDNVATLPLSPSSKFIRTFGPNGGGGGGSGFVFDTVLGTIADDLRAFQNGRVSSYYELRSPR